MKGFIDDIGKRTEDNRAFRRVLYTGKHMQLVLMSLQPGEDIGEEIHDEVDQFFRVEKGKGADAEASSEHFAGVTTEQ